MAIRRYATSPGTRETNYLSGPWVGVYARHDFTGVQDQSRLQLAQNMCRDDENGGTWRPRPGYAAVGTAFGATIQCVVAYTKLSGSHQNVAIQGGQIYSANGSLTAWTLEVTSAEIVTAGGALNTTGNVYCCVFADVLIITDGTNVPISWDGSHHAGITPLTNAPVAYGMPTVYYAKLFFIKNTDRRTIVWSEEMQPNVGYEAGIYDNAWTLGQTDQEPLVAIMGTDEALYYFRNFSTGKILGAVSTDFRTTGTHEAVSQSIGCFFVNSLVLFENDIFLTDATGRPQRLLQGGQYMDRPALWEACWEDPTVEANPRFGENDIAVDPNLRVVLYGTTTQYIAFEVDTNEYLGVWIFAGGNGGRMGSMRDLNSAPLLVRSSSTVYRHRLLTDRSPTVGSFTDNGTGVQAQLTTPYLGLKDHWIEKLFTMLDIECSASIPHPNSPNLFVHTNNGHSDTLVTISVSDASTERVVIGLNNTGRRLYVHLSQTTAETDAIGVVHMMLRSRPTADAPGVL